MKANPHNYDAWFDYLRLLESDGDVDQVREVYERAIANVPPSKVSTTIVIISNNVQLITERQSKTKCTENADLIYLLHTRQVHHRIFDWCELFSNEALNYRLFLFVPCRKSDIGDDTSTCG